ncbi:hypothetical protein [Stenotrophomonas indicatrix]|uniref:hypothetical protein n=1 Tax=Stenotrophomonas indicatrix TaxID=2045451 RepID=UPI00320B8636
MKMPGWGVLPAVLLAAVAMAQTNVYKCTGGEHPVYQQTPCQGRAEWRWEVPGAESKARGPTPAAVQPARSGSRRTPRRGHAQGALISITADPRGCERARQRQVAALASPRRLDYLQRRQLDDAVREACR